MKKIMSALVLGLFSTVTYAGVGVDYLIKYDTSNAKKFNTLLATSLPSGAQLKDLGVDGWVQVKISEKPSQLPYRNFGLSIFNALNRMPGVVKIQPNYKIKLYANPALEKLRAHLRSLGSLDQLLPPDQALAPKQLDARDNPSIPAIQTPGIGKDPLASRQWGMKRIQTGKAWKKSRGDASVVVAVIDTGVDYTHEDLVDNLWRNPGETGSDAKGNDKSTNGIDDDQNGYVDDVIGWDFVGNDNRPYDLAFSGEDLLAGGNPGHGTHCAGNIAARGKNGLGISGVAPNVSIMPLRFISESGAGDTAGAVGAIVYAVKMGARVTSNSWGSEGEEEGNPALRDALRMAQAHGVLFVAAAGNGRETGGYDNDTDPRPAFPASYPDDIIVSVAAVDSDDNLASFSNWGKTSVDIGAPGVNIFSTTVGSNYSDTVITYMGQKITWDGTSMAAPHVAGAAALYWSAHPEASWQEVKAALLASATQKPSLEDKVASGGRLNLLGLMNQSP